MEHIVYESIGNHSVMVGSFDNPDFAAEFVENRAQEDARSTFPEGTEFDDIQEEWWEAVELALTYYSIEERE